MSCLSCRACWCGGLLVSALQCRVWSWSFFALDFFFFGCRPVGPRARLPHSKLSHSVHPKKRSNSSGQTTTARCFLCGRHHQQLIIIPSPQQYSKNATLLLLHYVTSQQVGLDGTPEVLLDPNTLSKDGTSALSGVDFSKDGKILAYGISKKGSDW